MGDRKAETPGIDTVEMSSAGIKTAITGSNKAIGYLGFGTSNRAMLVLSQLKA